MVILIKKGAEVMYVLGFIAALVAVGVFVDYRQGNFKDRKPHDTNPNNHHANHSAENAHNSSGFDQHSP